MAGEKILIVDDEDSMLQFLSILLAKDGYEVHIARSGKEALAKAEEELYDVVVTDIKMPGEIDGLGVLSGVKKLDPSVPVVIRTRNNLGHWLTPLHRVLGRLLNPED